MTGASQRYCLLPVVPPGSSDSMALSQRSRRPLLAHGGVAVKLTPPGPTLRLLARARSRTRHLRLRAAVSDTWCSHSSWSGPAASGYHAAPMRHRPTVCQTKTTWEFSSTAPASRRSVPAPEPSDGGIRYSPFGNTNCPSTTPRTRTWRIAARPVPLFTTCTMVCVTPSTNCVPTVCASSALVGLVRCRASSSTIPVSAATAARPVVNAQPPAPCHHSNFTLPTVTAGSHR